MSDFIASLSLGVHGLILHPIARTLPAHSSHILCRGLGKERGKMFHIIFGIGKYEAWFF